MTPDGTLFIPAPPGAPRDKQAMVLSAVDYYTSSAMFRAASDPRTLDVVEAVGAVRTPMPFSGLSSFSL